MSTRHEKPYESSANETTPQRLIAAAERLFAEQGVAATSLRLISAAAGQANVGAAQYHFANKAGLISAIFAWRLPWLETRRAELLAPSRQRGGRQEIQHLIHIAFAPIAELRNEDGRLVYARFLLRVLLELRDWEFTAHPLSTQARSKDQDSPTVEVQRRLIERLAPLSPQQTERRLQQLLRLFVSGVVDWEDDVAAGRSTRVLAETVDDLIRMSAAAISAPAGPDKR